MRHSDIKHWVNFADHNSFIKNSLKITLWGLGISLPSALVRIDLVWWWGKGLGLLWKYRYMEILTFNCMLREMLTLWQTQRNCRGRKYTSPLRLMLNAAKSKKKKKRYWLVVSGSGRETVKLFCMRVQMKDNTLHLSNTFNFRAQSVP